MTMMNLEKRKGHSVPVIKKALVELDGPLFALYDSNRELWEKEDYFSFVGPVQYEFETPKPYLAVPPTQESLFLSLDTFKPTESCFANISPQNLNPLSYKLSQ